MKKFLTNIIYNGIYQVFLILIPILTIPYISRVLGVKLMGEYSYYFSLFSFLGVLILFSLNQYGSKKIAESTNLSKDFINLWFFQLVLGCIMIGIVFLFSIISKSKNLILYLPFLLASTLDITWFYIGISEVKKIVIRNTSIKLLSIILIFSLVKNQNDMYIYILINSLSTLIANLIFFYSLRKYVSFSWKLIDKKYLKSVISILLLLFIPQLALQIYTNLDKVLVGEIAGNTQLSYYDQSQKIARIVLSLVSSVSIVLMPYLARNKDKRYVEKVIEVSATGTLLVSSLFALNLFVNTTLFIPWFFGKSFEPMVINMLLSSIIIITISYGGVFANQFALSQGLFKIYAIPYICGAIIDFLLIIFLVPLYHSFGATLSLIITEIIVCSLRIVLVRKFINIKSILSKNLIIVVILFLSIVSMNLLKTTFSNVVVAMILNSVLATSIFLLLNLLFNNEFRKYCIEIKQIIKKRRIKK